MLNVFTAFSGYDSQCMALDRLGVQYDLVGWSEIDKYAIQAHDAVYPQFSERNFGDISKINWKNVPDFDLFTYSFPCTDISSAGQQKGLEEGSGTRSSLLWECRKSIEIKRPKYLLLENVKALTHKKFLPYLRKWMTYLEKLGYSNFAKVLNAKDYGIPQNRERLFVISILDGGVYSFPRPFKLKLRLKDVVQKFVDEKYYLSEKTYKGIIQHCERKVIEGCGFNPQFKLLDDICGTISTKYDQRQTDTFIISYTRDKRGKVINRRLKNISNTIHTSIGSGGNTDSFVFYDGNIRKLTPRECFRLMGVSEIDIDKIQKSGISDSQQYKMAGNSIVVDVLYHVFRKLFIDKYQEYTQLQLF